MIFISGITISFFLSLLLLFKKGKNRADYLLMIWFLFICIHQLLFYLDFSGYNRLYPFLMGVIIPFPLVHGPLLFFYVSALVNHLPKKKIRYVIHFLPFILCFLYMIKFFKLPVEQRHFIMANDGVGFETFILINFITIVILGVGYITWSLILIKRHQRNIQDKFSNLAKINLKWLQYLTYGLGMIWVVVIFSEDVHIFISVTIFMILIGFFGIRQVGIFTNSQLAENTAVETSSVEQIEKQARYEKSGLTPEKKLILKNELNRLMGEKIFLNPGLSLDTLAAQLDIHTNYLSQFINEELGVTFYDYINNNRVKEFEKLISKPDNQKFTILALAYECGFNSKSSFNRHFKKVTGKSPSEYLRNRNIE